MQYIKVSLDLEEWRIGWYVYAIFLEAEQAVPFIRRLKSELLLSKGIALAILKKFYHVAAEGHVKSIWNGYQRTWGVLK